MSAFFSRRLPWLSGLAVLPWLIILAVSCFSLATSSLAFDDSSYFSASIMLGVAILLTTVVLMGLQMRASEQTGERVRGAGMLGGVAAVMAIAVVWFVPVWAGLFVWAVAATVVRSRTTDLTSPAMRIVVLSGLGAFAIAIPIAGFVNLTADMLGTILWLALLVLSAALIAWHVDLAVRAARLPGPAPTPVPPT